MKKLMLLLVLTVLSVGSIFAQGKNTIAGTILGVSYERNFTTMFSVGVETGMALALQGGTGEEEVTPIAIAYNIDLFGRWYPFRKAFFVELGLGYGMPMMGEGETGGFLMNPEVGWKIDLGQAGGWIMEAGLGMQWTVGGSDGMMIMPAGGLAIGYSF